MSTLFVAARTTTLVVVLKPITNERAHGPYTNKRPAIWCLSTANTGFPSYMTQHKPGIRAALV
jgi:hypothetical protein